VRGSVILIGGDPGHRQVDAADAGSAALARQGSRVAYISGEEAVAQVRLRAERLGLSQAPVELAAETNVEDIVATLSQGTPPALASSTRSRPCGPKRWRSAPGHRHPGARLAQSLIRFAKTTARRSSSSGT
jgi:DNA repair protein RadA/Sms